MKKFIYILFLAILCSGTVNAQSPKQDSLLNLLKNDKVDSIKVIHLFQLCYYNYSTGEYNDALKYGNESLTLSEKKHYKKGVANAYNILGAIYTDLGNYPQALKMLFTALKVLEELKQINGMASCYNNIGIIYNAQKNYSEALKNYKASLKNVEILGNKEGIGACCINLGEVCRNQNNNPEAKRYFLQALKIYEETEDKQGLATVYNNIAVIFDDEGNYPESIKNHLISLKIKEEIEDQEGVAITLLNLGLIYTKQKKIKESEKHLNEALTISKELGTKDWTKEAYNGLYILDSLKGDFKAAFTNHKMFILYGDSLENEETKKKTIQSAMTYEFEKKEIATKAEQEKLNVINEEEKQQQKIIILSVTGVLLLVIVFSVFLFNRFRITQKQKIIIEKQKTQVDEAYESLHEKNKEVMDSINYASRIQRALLPPTKYIETILNRRNKV